MTLDLRLKRHTVDSLAQIEDATEYASKRRIPIGPFMMLVEASKENAPKGTLGRLLSDVCNLGPPD